jgi:hypothetical protein
MKNRIFISYRRDDAAAYAGRHEEALEKQFGRGSVFRDVLDLSPGDDFAAAIRERLAAAQAVLALIGPRWAGTEAPGARRIDDPHDFVRLELTLALQSGTRVVPVLLRGAVMPREDELPEPLKPLARRQALALGDIDWDADIGRLVDSLGVRPGRRMWGRAAGAVLATALLAAVGYALRPSSEPAAADRLIGVWKADVRYAWGDRFHERFDFKRHAGDLTGTASFLAYPRAIDRLTLEGSNVHFQTHSMESMGDSTRQLTHAYAGELRGSPDAPRLALRMQTSGGHFSVAPIEFEARPLDPGDSEAPSSDSRPAAPPERR